MNRIAAVIYLLGAPLAAAADCGLLQHRAERLLGDDENLCQYAGRPVLVVNTASLCGLTPQYEGLQTLYTRYQKRGLVILGFPSADFGNQEYADETTTAKFCKKNYGVSFPMFRSTPVTGAAAHPLFKELAEASGSTPKWNFHKYLIGADGKTVRAFDSKELPDSAELIAALEAALKNP